MNDTNRNAANPICYLCYFGLLLLLPYLTEKDDEFVVFHSNQGLLLLIACVALSVVAAIPIIGWIIALVGWVFTLVCFVKGLVSVSRGEMNELPIIGGFTILS